MKTSAFYLTRGAARQIREIYAHSLACWGQAVADRYVAALYATLHKAASSPKEGRPRVSRSAPFSMISSGKHFIVYDFFEKGMVVLAFLHQRRDVEAFVQKMEPFFLAEIESLKKKS